MKLKITVHGVAYEVDVEVLDPGEGFAPASPLPVLPHGAPPNVAPPAPPHPPAFGASPAAPASGESAHSVTAPIAGTVIEMRCRPGDRLAPGQEVAVLEAMKMKTSITSPAAGVVKAVPVAAGDTVREGQVLVELE